MEKTQHQLTLKFCGKTEGKKCIYAAIGKRDCFRGMPLCTKYECVFVPDEL